MDISELPRNWRKFAEPILLQKARAIVGDREGAYDARCPGKEDGPIVIITKEKAFLLSEANLVTAIQSSRV